MTNATDIITYVGIPLAVLGVLPILYTSLLAVLNQRRIRAALVHHGHKPATTSKRQQDGYTIRSSPMTTLIEVELPKYAIAPLERVDERYWKLGGGHESDLRDSDHLLTRAESTLSTIEEGRVQGYLRGGSWRAFQWKKITVGKKLYRIQYVDELREPPAEVDFSELIHFLLDWGTELDPMGWEKLRSGGLWTPAGTVLLKLAGTSETKDHKDWVLRTSMPDESDGILSLCVRWPETYHDITTTRGATSLPPGWGRLVQPISDQVADENEETKDFATRIADLKPSSKPAMKSTSMRFKIDSGSVSRIYWEHENKETGASTELLFPSKFPQIQAWFTSAASSLLLLNKSSTTPTSTNSMLWGFTLPPQLTSFTLKDTIPVGILVLLDLLSPDSAPHWTTSTSPVQTGLQLAERHHSRFQAGLAARRLEAAMPPEQARIAKLNRESAERRDMMDDMRRDADARREYEERRMADALVSAKMGNKAVVELCLKHLVEVHEINDQWTVYDVVEAVLYLLVLDQAYEDEGSLSYRIAKILDEWVAWANGGGMKREQFQMLWDWKVEFCYAVCIVAVVREAALATTQGGNGGMGKASVDMLECLNMWRKVRLG